MKYAFILFLFFSSISIAATTGGGWSKTASPTRIDVERGNGFMVYGAFGNIGKCTDFNADQFYVSVNHPQYELIYSTAVTALVSGKKLKAYINECKPVEWYGSQAITYNTLTPNGMLVILN